MGSSQEYIKKLDQWGHDAGEEALTEYMFIEMGSFISEVKDEYKIGDIFGFVEIFDYDWFYVNEEDYHRIAKLKGEE